MRHLLALSLAIGCLATSAAAFQGRTGGAASSATASACSILTRDLVVPFAENKKVLDMLPPEEETLAGSGSACEWGVVRLQLYPAARGAAQKATAPNKEFQPVAGAGDAAFFRNNRNTYAELVVWTGMHYFTLQVGVPTGRTAEAIRPDVLALANAVIKKLR